MKDYTSHCFIFLFLTFLCPSNIYAQYAAPKPELRGVWIATVTNIDFPTMPSTDDNYLRDAWIQLIDKHKALGINTLFVQIRPTADAFYPSNLVPSSRYLTGQSGLAPANSFDMLAFMIETTHERGMQFHAWLNPYRVSMDHPNKASFAPNHVLRAHPEWCIFYNKQYILNPGLPEVRAHMNDVMTEIVSRYAVDGIHFDDYFYPYKVKNETFNDYSTFKKYQSGFSNIEDWRRNNVDLLISELSQTIKRLRPTVQFGISPFSVWRNSSRDPEGSATRAGVTCYDDLYADVRKWLRAGWIDYVVPQAYRAIGDNLIDHAVIMKWWSDNAAGKNIYTGHGTYRVGESSGNERSWRNPNEIPRQIRLARSLPNVYGSVHFSSKSLLKNALGISDSLRLNYYRYPSASSEIYTSSPIASTTFSLFEPYEIRTLMADKDGKVEIRWRQSSLNSQQRPFQYIVHRFKNGQVDFQNGQNIIGILPPNTNEYIFYESKSNSSYQYSVTVSECVNANTVLQAEAVEKTKPKVDPSVLSTTKAPRKHRRWFGSFWRRVFGR